MERFAAYRVPGHSKHAIVMRRSDLLKLVEDEVGKAYNVGIAKLALPDGPE